MQLEIGITGGIGSGKTTICRIFEVLGIPVFYADAQAKKLMNESIGLIDQIKYHFGDAAYDKNAKLDRTYLASAVFNDSERLSLLNSLVHPATIEAYNTWVKNQNAPYVMKEAALLFETGSYKMSSFNVLVSADEHLRIERVMQRDNLTFDQVKARIAMQMPEEEKVVLADFIIQNDLKSPVLPQSLRLHNQFLALSKQQ